MNKILFGIVLCGSAAVGLQTGSADELSTHDQVQFLYSNQLRWNSEGLPVVTVRVAEGRSQVAIVENGAGGVRVSTDSDGITEVRAGGHWTVRAAVCPANSSTCRGVRPGKIVWHVAYDPADSIAEAKTWWQTKNVTGRILELGALFSLNGKTVDTRHRWLVWGEHPSEARAMEDAVRLGDELDTNLLVLPEVVTRPTGVIEAEDEKGTIIRSPSVLWFAPGSGELLTVPDIETEDHGRETRHYQGKIYVTFDRQGKLAVVNAISEDQLLEGLLPAEMMASAPLEALKAQTVAARNQLLVKIGSRHLTDPYRLCSTQHCQVYAGAGHGDQKTARAVRETRGEFLVHKTDCTNQTGEAAGACGMRKLVDSVYSSSCGGRTENTELVWGGAKDPALRGRMDNPSGTPVTNAPSDSELEKFITRPTGSSYCSLPRAGRSAYRWSQSLPLQALVEKYHLGSLTDIKILARGVSGRILKIGLVGSQGQTILRGELTIRRALGRLKSSLFILRIARDAQGTITQAVAAGGGFGHGVGLCQWGAIGMAEQGRSYREILEHYYGAATVEKLY